MVGDPSLSAPPSSEGARGTSEGSGGFIENIKVNVELIHPSVLTLDFSHFFCLKRAIRVRSHSFETIGVPKKVGGSGLQKPKVNILNKGEHD